MQENVENTRHGGGIIQSTTQPLTGQSKIHVCQLIAGRGFKQRNYTTWTSVCISLDCGEKRQFSPIHFSSPPHDSSHESLEKPDLLGKVLAAQLQLAAFQCESKPIYFADAPMLPYIRWYGLAPTKHAVYFVVAITSPGHDNDCGSEAVYIAP
ncbi:hypothetical protein JOB18_027985 [Solea senegalensis]|uniref:Uncharacterized protein n=1 Tax=Solea senegalensis TaxID=28829 RepID=A0AAV6R3N0_SOLSE|nr:hypothetical protein JOB18_027985 [Solea senegalensis]